ELPPQQQLDTTKALIASGLAQGIISPNYKVIGHMQATPTECPGGALMEEISKLVSNVNVACFTISFAVGSDGAAYEGRGWKILGAHSKYFNSVSIGICVIGDWTCNWRRAGFHQARLQASRTSAGQSHRVPRPQVL
ncbi:Peptidoglycan recognition protein-D, partial [Operophtera brumata]